MRNLCRASNDKEGAEEADEATANKLYRSLSHLCFLVVFEIPGYSRCRHLELLCKLQRTSTGRFRNVGTKVIGLARFVKKNEESFNKQ